MTRTRLFLATLALAPVALPVSAGLFDDDEARRQILEIKSQFDARFEQQAKSQLELANQLQRQADEIARLRGMLETTAYRQDATDKRVQDLYIDLDARQRRLEEQKAAAATPAAPDPGLEAQAYENALNLFKSARYKEAAEGFAAFVDRFPSSDLAPNAQFWLGNAWYGQRNCYRAIDMHNQVLAKYPNSDKAPDAQLAIATCQQEIGNQAGAKRSLEILVSKYPNAPAAETARQRLKKK